jgi:hypothetical protein
MQNGVWGFCFISELKISSEITTSPPVALSFSPAAEADFSFALAEAEPDAARVRPAAWVAPVAEAAELVAAGAEALVADALVAEPGVDAAAELAPVCSVAEALAADALVAELVADAAATEPG